MADGAVAGPPGSTDAGVARARARAGPGPVPAPPRWCTRSPRRLAATESDAAGGPAQISDELLHRGVVRAWALLGGLALALLVARGRAPRTGVARRITAPLHELAAAADGMREGPLDTEGARGGAAGGGRRRGRAQPARGAGPPAASRASGTPSPTSRTGCGRRSPR